MRWRIVLIAVFGMLVTQSPLEITGSSPAEAQRPDPPRQPVVCYEAADDRTTLGKDQSMRLCAGSASVAPVDCFLEADRRLMVSDDYNIQLCQCARSIEPVECFQRSQRDTDISEHRSLQICNARALWSLSADCR